MARYGLDSRTQGIDVADVRDRLLRSLHEIRRLCTPYPELGQAIVDAIRVHWKVQ
jgi:hypothetical protein